MNADHFKKFRPAFEFTAKSKVESISFNENGIFLQFLLNF